MRHAPPNDPVLTRFRAALVGTKANNLLRWFRAVWGWLREPRLFWLTTLVLATAIGGAAWLKDEPAFRLIGLGLQLLGIATVAWNIRDTRTLFGRPSTFALVTQWLHRRPRFRPPITVAGSLQATATASASLRVEIWSNPASGADVNTRLMSLEKNLSRLRDRLAEDVQATEKRLGQQVSALEEEKQVRARDDTDIRETLQSAQTGGLHVSAVGIVWLLVGVMMSTMSNELAGFVSFLSR